MEESPAVHPINLPLLKTVGLTHRDYRQFLENCHVLASFDADDLQGAEPTSMLMGMATQLHRHVCTLPPDDPTSAVLATALQNWIRTHAPIYLVGSELVNLGTDPTIGLMVCGAMAETGEPQY